MSNFKKYRKWIVIGIAVALIVLGEIFGRDIIEAEAARYGIHAVLVLVAAGVSRNDIQAVKKEIEELSGTKLGE